MRLRRRALPKLLGDFLFCSRSRRNIPHGNDAIRVTTYITRRRWTAGGAVEYATDRVTSINRRRLQAVREACLSACHHHVAAAEAQRDAATRAALISNSEHSLRSLRRRRVAEASARSFCLTENLGHVYY